MKFTKMSLVAALLIGSSAFALDNVKVSGDANLYYQTTDANSGTLFDKDSSSADTAVNLNVTADLLENNLVSISVGAGYSVLSTLGLEQNFVSSVWAGAHSIRANSSSRGAYVDTASWFNEAWVAATTGKTTAKLGRMALDTPLAFTETWTAEENTFDAAVVINQDIPNTTLVGAYVGNGNGTEDLGGSTMPQGPVATAAVVNENGDFDTYGKSGAYAAGVINNSYAPLVAQAWYYDVVSVAQAVWLQGDLDASSLGVDGLTLGGQYVAMTAAASGSDTNQAVAAKVGYTMKDMFTASVAYSQQSNTGSLTNNAFNTATAAGTAQSKLYTEAWWNYGQVTMKGAKAFNLTVEAPVKDIADFGLYVTSVDQNTAADLTEVTLTASRSFGPLDATLAYINSDYSKVGNTAATNTNTVQVYATLNF